MGPGGQADHREPGATVRARGGMPLVGGVEYQTGTKAVNPVKMEDSTKTWLQ